MILSEVKGMNQYLFEDWLRNRLDDLPPEELDRIVAFYLDAIAARMEDGMTEEEAIHDLGEPESLLAGIRASLPEYVTYAPVRQIRQKRTNRRRWLPIALAAAAMAAAVSMVLAISVPTRMVIDHVEAPVAVEVLPDIPEQLGNYSFDAFDLEKVTVAASLGSVQVEPSEDDMVHIIGDGALFEAVRRGNTLYVENVESDLILKLPDTALKVEIKCDVGNVELYEIIPQSLQVSCDLGNIILHNVSAHSSIALEADFGNIEGSLKGAETDYEIDVEVDLGDTNLSDSYHSGDEEIKLTATADLGNVHIDFEY